MSACNSYQTDPRNLSIAECNMLQKVNFAQISGECVTDAGNKSFNRLMLQIIKRV